MEHPRGTDYLPERKQTLHRIKEYISHLLKKKQAKKPEIEKAKQDLQDTLSSKNPQDLQEKKDQRNWWDKLKDMFSNDDDQQQSGGESGKSDGPIKKGTFEIPPEDSDEHIPQDAEFGESLGEANRFAEIYPPYLGYYTQGRKSYFNPKTNLRSKKKVLRDLEHTISPSTKKYQYAGVLNVGLNAVPLPAGAMPDTNSLCYRSVIPPVFHKDQNNCVYIFSEEKAYVSFNFALGQVGDNPPVDADTEKVIFDSLSQPTETLLAKLRHELHNGAPLQNIAQQLKSYIHAVKKYPSKESKQGTQRKESNSKNYIANLDKKYSSLDCLGANILFVGLCRELGIAARHIVGHMVQELSGEGKACLGSNNGHAWSEVWIGDKRVRFDATPPEKDNGGKSNQNKDAEKKPDTSKADTNIQDNEQQSGNNAKGNQQSTDKDSKSDATNDNANDTSNSQSGGDNSDAGHQGDNSSSPDNKQGGESSDQGSQNVGDKKDDTGNNQNTGNKSGSQKDTGIKKLGRDDTAEGGDDGGSDEGTSTYPQKSPAQLLDELIEKAKEDNLTKQAEKIEDALGKLDESTTKEQMREVLNKAGLTDFAKEMVDKVGNEGILEEEKKELTGLDDEKAIDDAMQQSLLDPEYRSKLGEYGRLLKEKLLEQRKKLKSEMERFGFSEAEMPLYKEYKKLEREVEPEVRRQIQELQKLLPPKYQILRDEENYYRSGSRIDDTKLVNRKVTGDDKVFQRKREELDQSEIAMFETLLIDRSGSMGNFSDATSPLRATVKTAIIRAKVLEHFKVNFSILFFDDAVEEIMEFGEKFSERKKCYIPSKLMRALQKSGRTNISDPLVYTHRNMLDYARLEGRKAFGNITFLGDGQPTHGFKGQQLKSLINQMRGSGFGLTAYYITGSGQDGNELQQYFGSTESGGTVVIGDIKELTKAVITSYNKNLKKIIMKYVR